MSENNKPRYPLQQILVEDLFSSNKLIVLLLVAILISSMSVIWVTHQTRRLISENGQLVLQRQALESEYRNLQVQEATEGDSTRVESIAVGTLKMKALSPEQEVEIRE
ncbi:cell division protein FtsL [Haemophilus haemolyticus]|jgi:cell division protein ftsL|uniref:Cell division protein FtsL n=1 Tax=Haemophilus haemolyticus TaxID=726 RepID=A0A2X4R273_HAEHA|nr:cell division protein FtsL [Haemophilus haemolyticus]EGT79497.1 Cell division protein ftsL [Haemophilus haemolyticus M21621]EGT80640.1 Cell division protein ftsL [Haemophilus haemolyticus M21621]KKZ53126.1 cell division protein FtsL [Haemophilus haemolyticus]SQH97187.1 Cell division protein FtsL [Haemophilus haemolyticus]BCL67288.1 cell division protein FtsL [Haemophilus haemolyticus]